MEVEAVALVLGEDHDPSVPGVDQVGEGEVDQPIVPGKWDRGLGPVPSQREQPIPRPTGEDHGYHMRTSRAHLVKPNRPLTGRGSRNWDRKESHLDLWLPIARKGGV